MLHRQTYVPTEKEHQLIEKTILETPQQKKIHYRNTYRDWVIFKTACLTGMRMHEVLNINLSWINWDKRTITIPAELNKTKTESEVWINDHLQTILQNYLNSEFRQTFHQGNLFVNLRGNNQIYGIGPLTVGGWAMKWRKYMKAAGLYEIKFETAGGLKFSKLRSHQATRSYFINQVFKLNPGLNMFDLSRITRHKSVTCLYKYYLRFNDLRLWQETIKNIK